MLCGAAVGALLFSVQVATMVFRDMPDDHLTAGRIAGRAFVGAYGVAAFVAVAAVVVAFVTRSSLVDRCLASAILVLAGLQLLWIAPAIVSHGSGWPGTFASLHAVGGAAHLLLAALALLLAWRFLGDVPDQRS
jgi:hypothetical protein